MRLPWKPRETKTVPQTFVSLSQLATPIWGGTETHHLVRDGYQNNAIAYRCVRMISEAAASLPVRSSLPEVQRLLVAPSPDQTGQVFRETLFADLQISGNAWLEAVNFGASNEPRALYNLRPDTVRLLRDRIGAPNGFAVQGFSGERKVLNQADGWAPILHLTQYNPSNPSTGFAPLVAARKALDIHDGTAAWAKALLDNSARPSGALIYGRDGSQLTDAQFQRLKDELHAQHTSMANAGRPLLLEGGLDWRPMSLTPTEMDFRETRHAAAREIALVFGVPPMLLGIPGDNTYATYKEAHNAFWRMTILPLAQRVAGALSVWLSGRIPKTDITLDLEDVPAFSSERDALWARIGQADFLSRDEKRRLLGISEAPNL